MAMDLLFKIGGSGSSAFNITTPSTPATPAIGDFVLADASGGAYSVTLPTAVGNTGLSVGVKKTDTSTNPVTINTPLSQTMDGRASGAVKLNRYMDYAVFVSDGTNWVISSKVETEIMSAVANGTTGYSGRSSGDYLTNNATVTLTPGKWRLRGYFSINGGNGTGTALLDGTGLYSADGANSGVAPAALSSGTNVKSVDGDALMDNYATTSPVNDSSIGANARLPAGFCEVVVVISGGNQAVYAVPRIDFGVAGTASTEAYVRAERIW